MIGFPSGTPTHANLRRKVEFVVMKRARYRHGFDRIRHALTPAASGLMTAHWSHPPSPPAARRTADWLGGGVGTVRDAFAQGVAGATVSGPARVVDGDTLEVRGTRVRLHGIDVPESKQRCRSAERTWPCGHEATRAFARRTVACEERDQDRYGRIVAVCRVGGEDVSRASIMVTAVERLSDRGWLLHARSALRPACSICDRASTISTPG